MRAKDFLSEYNKKGTDNFTADDINELSKIKDLATLKARAFQLISTPSKRPMKPEKVQWFKNRLEDLKSPTAVIKLMYDLLLSGEGHGVIGSRYSTNPNAYRSRFNEGVEGDSKEANAVVAEVIKLIGEGHTEVSPDVITTKVSAALGRPFMLKDLVAANNSSPELQHYIDSINPTKIKFSTDILTVKNEDPMKEKQAAQDGVAKMAARASNRPRLGESLEESLRPGEYHTHTVTFDDGTQGRINVPSDEFSEQQIKDFYAKKGKNVVKVDWDYSVQGEPTSSRDDYDYNRQYAPPGIYENAEELNVGDDVIITGPVEFEGETGVIDAFGRDKRFVIVNLYNHGRHSFHSSDVSFNDYAGSDEEEAEMYDRDPEFRNWAATQDIDEDKNFTNWVKQNNPNALKDAQLLAQAKKDYARSLRNKYKDHPANKDLDEDQLNEGIGIGDIIKFKKPYEHKGQEFLYGHVMGFSLNPKKLGVGAGHGITAATPYLGAEAKGLVVELKRTPYHSADDYYDRVTVPLGSFVELGSALGGGRVSAEIQKFSKLIGHPRRGETIDYTPMLDSEVAEGRERDPDWEYDQRRQEKLDIEAEKEQAKRPQKQVYTLVGRGPNYEANYVFPGEYDSQEAAVAARNKLMADPSTPNPRDIGIRTTTRYLDLKEGRETPLRDLEDYKAKKKALQDIQSDPSTAKDKELSTEVIRRLAGLEKQRAELK